MGKHWRRPLTQMYKINYNFGQSLYSNCLDEIDRKSNNRLSGVYDTSRPTTSERAVRTASQLMSDLEAEGEAFVADQKHTDELIAKSMIQVQNRRRNIMRSIEV
ncbi:uncharacterized protein LOC114828483 [Galendromus occidentalis]|uniref:Uncharacterized protein LOC114828483 n=1 Tax=Galendromus occidentalis TaxID=34638 RepID=A0AAJ7WIR8_9ACAR|nr:uncharacterized protein LOC114828483 [Galendromus occidentalis]